MESACPPATEVAMACEVSILIVNYRSAEPLRNCLASVRAETRLSHEVIVVDNTVPADQLEWLTESPDPPTLIRNGENRGFAAAVNQAARLARGRLLLLLNPDTVILDRAIDRLAAALDETPRAAAAGPRIVDSHGRTRPNTFPRPTLWRSGRESLARLWRLWARPPVRPALVTAPPPIDPPPPLSRDVEMIQGCCLMIRSDIFRSHGGLDERFFLYAEDMDLGHRLTRAGWRVVQFPQVVVRHLGAGSAQFTGSPLLNQKIGHHYLLSRYLYLAKTQGAVATRVLRGVNALLGILAFLLAGLSLVRWRRLALIDTGRLYLRTPCRPGGRPPKPSGGAA